MEKVTQGVHNEGGHIAVQLWHVGRISHNSLQPGQQAPVAPSAIAADTRTTVRDETGAWVRVPCSTPRALETEEIPASLMISVRQPPMPAKQDLTTLNCTQPMVICCINSCPQLPISVLTNMAAVLKTVPV